MKIAFDVNGTLEQPVVQEFFHWCVEQGHEVYIWSNFYGYSLDMAKTLKHPACMAKQKITKSDISWNDGSEEDYMDLCIDDSRVDYLAAKGVYLR